MLVSGWNQSSVNCADGIFGSDMDKPLDDFWDCMVTRECYEAFKHETQTTRVFFIIVFNKNC